MVAGIKSSVRACLIELEHEGLTVLGWNYTGASHVKFRVADAEGRIAIVYTAGTPSDRRGIRNFIAATRRALATQPKRAKERGPA